jgi:hypothetical protein
MSSLSKADDGAALAPIARLVANLKAQRASGATGPGSEASAGRDEERREWQEKVAGLEAELAGARAALAAARARHEQADQQHRRAMADLELMHEHQRSIWQLDRRRLEITIAGQETVERERRSSAAVAAALLVVGLFGAVLVADHRLGAGEAAEAQMSFPASGSSR